MRKTMLSAAAAGLLASCAAQAPYRFKPISGEGAYILQPAAQLRGSEAAQTVSIDLFDLVRSPKACGRGSSKEAFAWRVLPGWQVGRRAPVLRLESRFDVLTSDNLAETVRNWWANSALTAAGCLSPGAADSVFRGIMGQRPLTPEAAVAWWYGPGQGAAAPRIAVLRPGMRVCAHDVVAASTGLDYVPSATQCARLVDTPSGARFDAVASRFTTPLSGTTWGQTNSIRQVASWAEVQQPFNGPNARPAYILFYTSSLKGPTATSEPRTLPLILAADLAGPLMATDPPPLLDRIAAVSVSGSADPLCGGGADSAALPIVCIQFGERGTFSVDFPIRVNGAAQDVQIGATLGAVMSMAAPDLLTRDIGGPADVGRAGDAAAQARLIRTAARVKLLRWYDGRRVRVRMSPAVAHLMPLQPGDDVRW